MVPELYLSSLQLVMITRRLRSWISLFGSYHCWARSLWALERA